MPTSSRIYSLHISSLNSRQQNHGESDPRELGYSETDVASDRQGARFRRVKSRCRIHKGFDLQPLLRVEQQALLYVLGTVLDVELPIVLVVGDNLDIAGEQRLVTKSIVFDGSQHEISNAWVDSLDINV
jgi:hypothetical protein